ncbi:hypothetical protein BD311DRAFT_601865, partial [Dichomitus squalens]
SSLTSTTTRTILSGFLPVPLGNWIRDLPNLLGEPSTRGHTRNISVASVQGHRLSSILHSCRLFCSELYRRWEGYSTSHRISRNLSRTRSFSPAFEHKHESPITLPPVSNGET